MTQRVLTGPSYKSAMLNVSTNCMHICSVPPKPSCGYMLPSTFTSETRRVMFGHSTTCLNRRASQRFELVWPSLDCSTPVLSRAPSINAARAFR
jgi:hypothetical protein